MSAFIRLQSATSCIIVAILSNVLLAAGTPIVRSVDDTRESRTPTSIVVSKPNGGQIVVPHSSYTIRWFTQGIDTVQIEYSLDEGRTWATISDAVPAVSQKNYHCPERILKQFLPSSVTKSMGSYTWNVPDGTTGEALIRVRDKVQPSTFDVSDHPFTIAQKTNTGWTTQSVGSSAGLVSVSIIDDQIAWTSGWQGFVFRTTNGGSNWIQGANVPSDATEICGVNADTAFVCANLTDNGRIYRTTDGGVSWTLVFQYTGPSATVLNVQMFDKHNGVAIGNPVGGSWKTIKTTNGGTSWDPLPQIPQSGFGYRDAVDWAGEQKGWFGTDGSLVYRTTDGGLTWSSSDVGSLDVMSLVFPTENTGLLSTAFRYAYKTTDGGSSWTYAATIPAPHPATIVAFLAGVAVPTLRWWATGLDEVYRTTNHGSTWTYETILDGDPLNDISMKYIEDKHLIVGYAAGAGGGMLKYTEIVTSVPDLATNLLPSTVALYQNYPNPFNPSTTLTFTIPHSSFVVLKVYNMLGQEVKMLVNEKMEAGTHRVQFNAESLTSGVYMCRIESGNQVASRKIMLLR